MPLMLRLALFLSLGEPAFLFCRFLRTGTLVPSLFACFLWLSHLRDVGK